LSKTTLGDLLASFSIRGFTPKTYGTDDVERKKLLRDKILSEIENIEEIRTATLGKRLSISVIFYLYEDPKQSKRYEKDLDNMLKIFCDVLPEYMDQASTVEGLGLMEKKRDDLIFELHANKTLVGKESDEGMDVKIKEFSKI